MLATGLRRLPRALRPGRARQDGAARRARGAAREVRRREPRRGALRQGLPPDRGAGGKGAGPDARPGRAPGPAGAAHRGRAARGACPGGVRTAGRRAAKQEALRGVLQAARARAPAGPRRQRGLVPGPPGPRLLRGGPPRGLRLRALARGAADEEAQAAAVPEQLLEGPLGGRRGRGGPRFRAAHVAAADGPRGLRDGQRRAPRPGDGGRGGAREPEAAPAEAAGDAPVPRGGPALRGRPCVGHRSLARRVPDAVRRRLRDSAGRSRARGRRVRAVRGPERRPGGDAAARLRAGDGARGGQRPRRGRVRRGAAVRGHGALQGGH